MFDRSNALIQAFLKHISEPVTILRVSPILEILESNQHYKNLISELGKDLPEDHAFLNLFSKTDAKKIEFSIAKALKEEEKVTIVTQLPQDISKTSWEIEITPIAPIEDKSVDQVICSLRRKEQHPQHLVFELSAQEQSFKGFIDNAPLAMCLLKGKELVTEYANRNMLKLWRKKRDQIIGIPQETARPELAAHQETLIKVKSIFDTGKPLILNDLKASTPDTDNYLVAMYQPIKNDRGEVTSLFIIVYDSTDQVNFRKELLKAKDILKLAMDASGMGSWNLDFNTKKLYLSERAQEIYMLNNNQLSIEEAKSIIATKDVEYVRQEIRKALHHKSSFNIEYEIKLNGTNNSKWLRSTGKAYYDEEGLPIYIAGAVLDITEVRNDELRKNDFISMVSHELRTPLTSLSAYIHLLQYKFKEKDDSFAIETLEKVGIQLKRMSLMIDGFLNVSLLESGKIRLNKSAFELIDLIKSIAEENRVVLPSHFIQVISEAPVIVHADKDKIANVLNNLISNAAKYSRKESFIAIKCESNKNEVIVSIEDEGIGIKNSDLRKLFNRFFRVESPDTKTISGFGVGLYICAEIIQQHGGQIWAESELKQGSTFYFSLPL